MPVFKVIDFIQESALPLLLGVVLALILENTDSSWYTYYFKGTKGCGSGHDYDDHYNATDYDHHRLLAGGGGDDPACARWLLSECSIFGHELNLHFIANDILMVFHFGLAMKEVGYTLPQWTLPYPVLHHRTLTYHTLPYHTVPYPALT